MLFCTCFLVSTVFVSFCFCVDRTYVGCFLDDSGNRVLPHIRFDSDIQTNDRCAQHCCTYLEEAIFSGTELMRECYCGSNADSSSFPIASESDCNKLCPGNPLEFCGAHLRLSISRLNCSIDQQMLPEPTPEVTSLSEAELDERVNFLRDEILIDKKETSSFKYTKVCAPDDRISSQYIGVGGIIVIVSPALFVILSDIFNRFRSNSVDGKGSSDGKSQ